MTLLGCELVCPFKKHWSHYLLEKWGNNEFCMQLSPPVLTIRSLFSTKHKINISNICNISCCHLF